MNIVFPENVNIARQGTRPLNLKHVLALVYCFGGIAGVLSLLSKFVINPLFEELTYERRLLVEESRNNLIHLNALLSHATVPRRPGKPKAKSPYVEHLVHANESSPKPLSDPNLEARTASMIADLREFRENVKSLDPNDDILRTQSSLVNQGDELSKYCRQVQYETIPSSIFAASMSKTNDDNERAGALLGEALLECQKEVRSLKSSLLS